MQLILNNIQRKAYTCHSERSGSEVEPAGQRLAVGISKRKVDIVTYFTPPRLRQTSLSLVR